MIILICSILVTFFILAVNADEVNLYESLPAEIPEDLTIPEKIYRELNTESEYSEHPLQIAQVSDIHHYSSKLYNADSPIFEGFSYNNEGRTVLYSSDVLYALKAELLKKGIDILLISGDLTVLGAEDTHKDVAAILEVFEDSGINVFVTTGNHDINNPKAFRITRQGTALVDTVSPEEFREIYQDFGYSEAVMSHEDTLSYLADLGDDYLLLSLDTSYYQDNFQLGYSASYGIISPSLYDFAEAALQYGAENGKEIIVMSHQNFLEHYEIDFDLSNFMISEPQRMIELLSSYGVKLAVSGHIHKSDIKALNVADNTFYGAAVTAFSQYPHTYRLIGLSSDSAGISDFSLAHEKNIALSKEILTYNWYIYYRRNYYDNYNRLIKDTYSRSDALAMAEYFYLTNLYSQQGLEEYLPEDVLSSKGAGLYSRSNSFMKGFAETMPLDSPPSDSDVRLEW